MEPHRKVGEESEARRRIGGETDGPTDQKLAHRVIRSGLSPAGAERRDAEERRQRDASTDASSTAQFVATLAPCGAMFGAFENLPLMDLIMSEARPR